MQNIKAYSYLVIGFLAGFMLGVLPEEAGGFPLQRLGYFVAAIIVILLYNWFESTSHRRHMSKWESHRNRGKAYFVISHYVAARAIPVFLIFIIPLDLRVHLTGVSVQVLAFTAFIALVAFVLLGYQEWSRCESECSVRALREAAQRVREGKPGLEEGTRL